jgi:hypothetical protein
MRFAHQVFLFSFLVAAICQADTSTHILNKGEQVVFDAPTLGVNNTLILPTIVLKTVDVAITTKEAAAAPLPEKVNAYTVRLARASDPNQTIVAEVHCENPSKGYGNNVTIQYDALECSNPVHVFEAGTPILK